MGEMADLCLMSSDPYDEFERSGEPGISSSSNLTTKVYKYGKLQSKSPNFAIIDGKEYIVTDKATKFLQYIKIGSMVHFRHSIYSELIYYIRKE